MFRQFARITSNLRFAIFSDPKRDSQKKGVQSGNPQSQIRTNQAIRTNLQLDSRELREEQSIHYHNRKKIIRTLQIENPIKTQETISTTEIFPL